MRFGGVISVLFLVSSAFTQNGPTITVHCDHGQSLNGTLSKLNKDLPTTILVQGTCTEYVTIDGFENLTITGQSGAAIQQPVTNPKNIPLISITASQEVTVSGLAVHSPSTSGFGIGSSRQILLQNLNIDGPAGVLIYEQSQVLLTQVNVNLTSGFAAIQVYAKSDVQIAGGLLTRQSDGLWNVGVFSASGHVGMQGTTIRDMQQGIGVTDHGSVDIGNGADVTIDNPSGTNFAGVAVSDSSSLGVGQARLLINNAGQTWGGDTGGVFVTNGSTLDAGANLLVVSNSQGHGIIVTNNSHATLAASSITGSLHGGLVAANLSTIDSASGSLTLVSGNATDLFCDSNSFITGTANLTGVSTVNCANQLPNNTVPLP